MFAPGGEVRGLGAVKRGLKEKGWMIGIFYVHLLEW